MHILRKKLIHLHRCRGITRNSIRKMLRADPSLSNLYKLSSSQLSHQYTIPFQNAQLLYSDLHDKHVHASIKHDLDMFPVVTIVDDNYPPVLKTIKDPPFVLYMLGDLSLLSYRPALSVIGTRRPSQNAYRKMQFILPALIEKGLLLVSGMAKGIDGYAHQLALQHNGKTIAVLGSGFHHIYPKQNRSLFQRIAQAGLVLSEYTPNTPPERFHFPERNRIISGLSFATLVIEATERSGTLITVDQALDQGREVYAVPDSPLLPQTVGCHRMIQDGAKLVMSAHDILEDWESMKHISM
ncbi:DNA-protecting protein DprA [Virgibacillus dakarensis]|uniref:DNA processing protein DprA n=1 Tax=Lentibacillus populi TaxID=1827502 RepID=A0A9W5TU78_9BACI|nr:MULTISPECIES: DNA-processing protein DprA [Bacillaceae]MBT2216692.1 DNA-processing protein DprA [Virgibacillus dakarensis]MTW86643.1 DNA-protecting protein DprA [Virgibacillus dakarensis]GGB30145.1 DNA processing protein DprA [Lentibacillus populi]